MRTRITLIICLCLFAVGRASAQWAVIDPSNIAQSISFVQENLKLLIVAIIFISILPAVIEVIRTKLKF